MYDDIGDIYVVDYGSSVPINLNMKGVTVLRYTKNKYFNKSHALNLGIKHCKNDYIATIDCDIMLCHGFIDKVKKHLIGDVLVISRNIRRVDKEYLKNTFNTMWKFGKSWAGNGEWPSHAVGGIQMFSKRWIYKVHGYNENLVLIGGMDSRVFDQAVMDSIPIIDINLPIIHQEHKKIKNEQFSNIGIDMKLNIVAQKAEYLDWMKKTYKIKNDGYWGEKFPNQNRFIGNEDKKEMKIAQDNKTYQEAFVEAVKNGKKYFMFQGKKVKIFK